MLNIDSKNLRMEIRATWIGTQWQRTWVNTEAKYLMLRHAFETLACIRMEFNTDSWNERSLLDRRSVREKKRARHRLRRFAVALLLPRRSILHP